MLIIPPHLVPLILKGVQRWEDALRAYDTGIAGVVLSNHGGRQLDTAPSGIEILVSVVKVFKEKRGITFPLKDGRFQLFVDGGVRRASDVLKAVALGATAVGIGRPFLYAYSAYGVDGVDKALSILKVSLFLFPECVLVSVIDSSIGRIRDEHASPWHANDR